MRKPDRPDAFVLILTADEISVFRALAEMYINMTDRNDALGKEMSQSLIAARARIERAIRREVRHG